MRRPWGAKVQLCPLGTRPSRPSTEALDRGIPADQVSLIFAGGIHDARSAALVAALAGPSASGYESRDLIGTAYLFDLEAVSDDYQAHPASTCSARSPLRSQTTTMANLHQELSIASSDLVDQALAPRVGPFQRP